MVTIETIAIGDEILTGKISDTNSTFVADQLFALGLSLSRETVVADDEKSIVDVLDETGARSEFAICFGGLGPTSDDKTAEVVARRLACNIVEDAPSKLRMEAYYRERNRAINPHSLKQVRYPEKCEPIPNKTGMAPGFRCQIGKCTFYFLPGVPCEMKSMFAETVLPDLKRKLAEKGIPTDLMTHQWRCIGIPESELQTLMDPIEAAIGKEGWLGYRTHFPENHLHLYLRGSGAERQPLFRKLSAQISELVSPWCYTQQRRELEDVVIGALQEQSLSLAVAESCTGGCVASRLTRVAGSSDHFWGGVTPYQWRAKKALLNVAVQNAAEAVSSECSRKLAEGVRNLSGASIGAAITGYLGPSGGTERDPVGTLYLCVLGKGVSEKRLVLPRRDRAEMQWGAAGYLLDLIATELK